MLSLQLGLTYDIDLFAVAFWQSFFASTLQQSIYQFYLLETAVKHVIDRHAGTQHIQ